MMFWQELRRRRVYRLAGFYIVAAWLVIQVAEMLFQAWGVSETALRYLFIAATACFPVALIFSWYYDITPKGIVRTESVDASETVDPKLKRADYFVLTALLAVGLAILLGSAEKIQEEIETAPDKALVAERREHSIAVLPFTNLDTNPDTGFFSDGITEEILHRLSTLGALHVLASNSSFAFRDSQMSISEISKKLGVRYLLQGSIRRDNDYVRLTARLIDDTGFQIWSQTFDRKLESIFAIQTQIASTVSSQIINEIVPIQKLPAGRTTTNMEAYNEYLVGRVFYDARAPGWQEKTVAAFQRAIELDPGFAPPYAGKAMAIFVMDGSRPSREQARTLAETALELDADLAEAHAILGLLLISEDKSEQAALTLRRSIELDPSFIHAYNWLGIVLLGQGLEAEANAIMELGLEIDPLNPPIVANTAARESREGNFGRAEQLLLRLLSLPEPPRLVYPSLYYLYDAWGRFTDAVAIAKQFARLDASSDQTEPFIWLAWTYDALGMTEDADYWARLIRDNEQDELETLDFTYNLLRARSADSKLGAELQQIVSETEFLPDEHDPWILCQFGLVNIQLGNFETGSEQLEYGLRLYLAPPGQKGPASSIEISAFRADPADVVYVMQRLAFAYQQVGRSDEANTILQALTDEFSLENNAMHYALLGDTSGALQAYRAMTEGRAAKYLGPGKYYELVNDPAWAETIQAPEFQELLAEVKEDIDRQRAVVEAADAEHDFRAEIATLLANQEEPESGSQ